MKNITLNIKNKIYTNVFIPKKKKIQKWIKKILNKKFEITICIVDIQKIQEINFMYRKKYQPTNILSFLYQKKYKNHFLLGELVICEQIITDEAYLQKKSIEAHWAHIIIHGTLHLIGYHHKNKKQNNIMQKIEINIMKQLGYNNPYKN
ncbi:rRNA maturation RNase YbeY [Buchnera aphidicola]|uniref:Endoribonuclease YbeY n=1 Tax=Buchnera aphidicola (Sarucallis kahawaluokalani) TaxID=1241878 RepID=A0A4D6Y826_9GAMM|nr:rRNA maturation RNase YbeY [Buchnera aphidicola]QCI26076.1 rRNA maturation RNase YbeY [Buchnera aphidicola (Sarucallis kahawaluokalani)]